MKDVIAIKEDQGQILIYKSENGNTHIDVKMQEDTVWLAQQQMAELFQTFRTNVVEHIKIFMKKENWMKIQLVGISDRFAWRGVEKKQKIFSWVSGKVYYYHPVFLQRQNAGY